VLAVVLDEFGPPANLTLRELPDVVPGEGQVRVVVKAAGVHLVDTALRRGVQRGPIPLPPLPHVPGREVAGVVDAVGPKADPAWVGRRVVAHLGATATGGYSSLAVTAQETLHVAPDLGFPEAVALVGTGRMAVSVADVASFRRGDVVLITSAAGGVGTLVVQMAKRAGALVVGLTSGAAKGRQALANGADVAVDYRVSGWPEEVRRALDGRGVTVAIDGVGGAAGRAVLELLDVGGRLVIIGFAPGEEVTAVSTDDLVSRGISAASALGTRTLQRPGGLRGLEIEALRLGGEGQLHPAVQCFPLADAARAHEALESRSAYGKVVLVP
jgi:NADPH2:quinone reductase